MKAGGRVVAREGGPAGSGFGAVNGSDGTRVQATGTTLSGLDAVSTALCPAQTGLLQIAQTAISPSSVCGDNAAPASTSNVFAATTAAVGCARSVDIAEAGASADRASAPVSRTAAASRSRDRGSKATFDFTARPIPHEASVMLLRLRTPL